MNELDTIDFSWTTRNNAAGEPELWITLTKYPNVPFTFTKLEWGKQDGNEVPLEYNVKFESPQHEKRSHDIPNFKLITEAIMMSLVKAAEQRAKQIVDNAKQGIEMPVDPIPTTQPQPARI